MERGVDLNVFPPQCCNNYYDLKNLKVRRENNICIKHIYIIVGGLYDPCADGFIYYKYSLCLLGQPTIAEVVVVNIYIIIVLLSYTIY